MNDLVQGLAAIIAAFGTLITASGAIWLTYRQQQMNRKVDGVHTIVNQQRTDMLRFQTALIAALVAHGVDVPVDQSLPIDPYEPPAGPPPPD